MYAQIQTQSSLTVHVGNGQGTSDRTDEAGAGVQDGHCPQRGGSPAAASQQQTHAGAAGHQAGQALHNTLVTIASHETGTCHGRVPFLPV